MDNIDLFDKYIKGKLSEKERYEFDTRLKDDKSFAVDFKVYSATVKGICKEAEQDNKDFEVAMKNISKKQLCEIIGKNEENIAVSSQANHPQEIRIAASKVVKTTKPNFFRTWMWQAACWTFIIGGSAIWIVRSEQNARYSVDNAIYASAYFYEGQSRGTINIPDLNSLNDKELKDKLPTFVAQFNECEDSDDIYEVGYPLAMAYMRLHERDKAKEILNEMINRLSEDDDYTEEISKLKSILDILK